MSSRDVASFENIKDERNYVEEFEKMFNLHRSYDKTLD